MANETFPTDDRNRIAVPQTALSQPTWSVAVHAKLTKNGYFGDALAPLAAVWVHPGKPCAAVIPGSDCLQALPVCVGDGITYGAVWLAQMKYLGTTPPDADPPDMQMEIRWASGGYSETLASGVLDPELMTDHGLLFGVGGAPLGNQMELWGRLDPATPDGTVVEVTLRLRIGAGGSGPLDVSYGNLMTSGLLVLGSLLGA